MHRTAVIFTKHTPDESSHNTAERTPHYAAFIATDVQTKRTTKCVTVKTTVRSAFTVAVGVPHDPANEVSKPQTNSATHFVPQ